MSLEAINTWAQLIAASGVIGSLFYHQPGVKTWWPMRRAAFTAGFRDYIESSQPIKDLPPIDRLIRGET
jgi:hypothetical protein